MLVDQLSCQFHSGKRGLVFKKKKGKWKKILQKSEEWGGDTSCWPWHGNIGSQNKKKLPVKVRKKAGRLHED